MAGYDVPDNLRYTEQDEWARLERDRVVIGVTDYAQQQLGDIVFVELPSVGDTLEKGDSLGVIESVKAVADLYAPVSGEVVEVNGDLGEQPEQINEDCYGDGWMVVIELDDPEQYEALLDAKAYGEHVAARED